jgi:hypothetical protein
MMKFEPRARACFEEGGSKMTAAISGVRFYTNAFDGISDGFPSDRLTIEGAEEYMQALSVLGLEEERRKVSIWSEGMWPEIVQVVDDTCIPPLDGSADTPANAEFLTCRAEVLVEVDQLVREDDATRFFSPLLREKIQKDRAMVQHIVSKPERDAAAAAAEAAAAQRAADAEVEAAQTLRQWEEIFRASINALQSP